MPQPLLLRLAKTRYENHTSQIVHFVEDPVSNVLLNFSHDPNSLTYRHHGSHLPQSQARLHWA
jgi:hypothetical protein